MRTRLSKATDSAVIRRSLEEPEAFAQLFDRHFRSVHTFVARRAAWQDPADIAGETFLIAFEARGRYDLAYESALPWLYGIARNVVRRRQQQDVRRSHAQAAHLNLVGTASMDPMVSAAHHLDAERELSAVLDALTAEPIESVDALMMYVWEGLSYEEIAQALQVPIGTIRSRISRLRDRLSTARGSHAEVSTRATRERA